MSIFRYINTNIIIIIEYKYIIKYKFKEPKHKRPPNLLWLQWLQALQDFQRVLQLQWNQQLRVFLRLPVAWRGLVWCCVVLCGVVWRSVVWRSLVWCGVALCGVVWWGVV